MASIVKRRKKFSVVYRYTDAKGVERQRWETFNTNMEARKRKSEIESEQEHGVFTVTDTRTISELMDEYITVYGINTWALSTYESRVALISNYIKPLIGDMKLSDATPRMMDNFYRELLKVKSVATKTHSPKMEYLTPRTVREIHKTLRNAFNLAVKWELISRNPVAHATLPKEEAAKRDIWTVETLFKALEACDDDQLSLAINLAFACSLRMGEMLGLTWDCVDISQESIEKGRANIFVNKELQRVNREVLEKLGDKDVVYKFPSALCRATTALVLKAPKTKTSVRRVYLPETVAQMLIEKKKEQEEHKALFGEEYTDFDLVFAYPNGRPVEGAIINRALNKLIKDNGLPKVVFHSLRHSSITYKLKLNGGDMKSVQGDSGHAQLKMVADVYSHIIDEDRCVNAQRMEQAFYSGARDDTVGTETIAGRQAKPQEVKEDSSGDRELVEKLLANPETLALLKSLAKAL